MNNTQDWLTRHALAMLAPETDSERAVVALVASMAYADKAGWVDDPFLNRTVVVPLADAIRQAMNADIGRLDAGTILEAVDRFAHQPDGEPT